MNGQSVADLVLPLTTLVLGALLGVLSGLLLERRKQVYGISDRIIDSYLDIRGQLSEVVSTLAGLRIGALSSSEVLREKQDALSNLYCRYYDFLPRRLLQEIHCLYACLEDHENRLYAIRDNELRLADEDEITELVMDFMVVDNFRYYALVPLQSSDRDTRRAACINYQARRVLHIINQDLSTRTLIKWSRNPRKSGRFPVGRRLRWRNGA